MIFAQESLGFMCEFQRWRRMLMEGNKAKVAFGAVLILAFPRLLLAAETGTIDSGTTAWMLTFQSISHAFGSIGCKRPSGFIASWSLVR